MGEGGPIEAKRRRHTPEQVIRKLREGKTIADVTKALEVSENTFYRWQRTYAADDVKRLKELERENRQRRKPTPRTAAQGALPEQPATVIRPRSASRSAASAIPRLTTIARLAAGLNVAPAGLGQRLHTI